MGDGDNYIKLVCDKYQKDTPELEGWGDTKGPQPVALKHAVNTTAKASFYRAEPGASEVIEDRRIAPMEHFGGTPLRSLPEVPLHQSTQHRQQEELKATLLWESCGLVAITGTWWDESYDWSVAIDGYKLLRRDGRGGKCGDVALYVK